MICTCTCTCNLQYLYFPPPFLFARCSSNFVSFCVQFSVHFVFYCGVHFGSKMKLFKCLLRAFLNLSFSSSEPPRREKYGFRMVKSHFLKMMHFGTLRFIMPSLESSWRILAHSISKPDPKTDLKMDPK